MTLQGIYSSLFLGRTLAAAQCLSHLSSRIEIGVVSQYPDREIGSLERLILRFSRHLPQSESRRSVIDGDMMTASPISSYLSHSPRIFYYIDIRVDFPQLIRSHTSHLTAKQWLREGTGRAQATISSELRRIARYRMTQLSAYQHERRFEHDDVACTQ